MLSYRQPWVILHDYSMPRCPHPGAREKVLSSAGLEKPEQRRGPEGEGESGLREKVECEASFWGIGAEWHAGMRMLQGEA